jgi:aspartate 1-decarboxylase
MLRPFCRCKIHQATVTSSSLEYAGSMTIPEEVMRKLDIREGEQVEVANINNGERWTTYAITGKKPRDFCLNGAAARLGQVGDRLIIMVFAQLNEEELKHYRMRVALMGSDNQLVRIHDYSDS